jgi:hypothetical protein
MASSEALDVRYRAMRHASYRCIRMAIPDNFHGRHYMIMLMHHHFFTLQG